MNDLEVIFKIYDLRNAAHLSSWTTFGVVYLGMLTFLISESWKKADMNLRYIIDGVFILFSLANLAVIFHLCRKINYTTDTLHSVIDNGKINLLENTKILVKNIAKQSLTINVSIHIILDMVMAYLIVTVHDYFPAINGNKNHE